MKLRAFVHCSSVEVFVNDRQCTAIRVYSDRKDSTYILVRAIGGNARLISLDAWQMQNIYE